jgi:hypothetical protein
MALQFRLSGLQLGLPYNTASHYTFMFDAAWSNGLNDLTVSTFWPLQMLIVFDASGQAASMAAQFRLSGLQLGLQPLTTLHLVLPHSSTTGQH